MLDRIKERLSLQLVLLLLLLWFALAALEGWWFGLLAVALALMASAWLAPMQFVRFSLPGLCRFIGYFAIQSVVGGLDVAYRAISPGMPLEIMESRYRFRLPDGQARTVYIGTVSLLPGTLACGLEGDELQIHSIAGDPLVELQRLEARVADLFGLTLVSCDAQSVRSL